MEIHQVTLSCRPYLTKIISGSVVELNLVHLLQVDDTIHWPRNKTRGHYCLDTETTWGYWRKTVGYSFCQPRTISNKDVARVRLSAYT